MQGAHLVANAEAAECPVVETSADRSETANPVSFWRRTALKTKLVIFFG